MTNADIVFTHRFKKKFKKLPPKIKIRFEERLAIFISDQFDPALNNHPVEKIFPNCRSINITGDYRAIFEKHEEMVVFITVGTHSDLYR